MSRSKRENSKTRMHYEKLSTRPANYTSEQGTFLTMYLSLEHYVSRFLCVNVSRLLLVFSLYNQQRTWSLTIRTEHGSLEMYVRGSCGSSLLVRLSCQRDPSHFLCFVFVTIEYNLLVLCMGQLCHWDTAIWIAASGCGASWQETALVFHANCHADIVLVNVNFQRDKSIDHFLFLLSHENHGIFPAWSLDRNGTSRAG